MSQRKWAEAAVVLKTVLKKYPDLSDAAMDLARSLAYSGRREEAISALTQLKGSQFIRRTRVLSRLFLTNATYQIYQDGLNFLFAKKYKTAREYFEKALIYEPDNVEILTRVGQCLVLDSDYDSAAERLRLAKRLNPFEPEIRLWLGRALHQRGELKEAIDELRTGNAELHGSEVAPIWLAEALFSSGQRGIATQVLEEDARVQPFHLQSLVKHAQLELQSGRRDSQSLWAARKNLQLATSRIEQYASQDFSSFKGDLGEGDLGLNLREPIDDLKGRIQKLLEQVESRLEEAP